MVGISLFAEVAFYLWVLSEIAILIKTKLQRKNVVSENKDKGSILFIVLGIFVCMFLNQLCSTMKIGYVNEVFSNLGSFLIIVGVFVRIWAVVVLGRHFSLSVSVDSKQKIIQNGPYRMVRHPAYTGMLMTFIGIGLAFNTWVGSLISFIFFLIVFGYRIRIEEKALAEMFPNDYPGYIQKTFRLIPFVW
ncbi:methyltransferase family protein [Falsibacillus albus]|uniref:Isoprenylcysteine carboxylmethyltransferase family protein n=1 Tax=Falsibacillus albus TaxID=2478915 RepID=A0A3L7K306_9BACI|nr:isoprenylcysteine carboxylmethyltransferase family protein [Falsibacillus albus]RLQ97487.1 isoprenylcysteine carboxylmethyltransferase family protein [Falsibacillus albus]